jgi:glucose/arabinose dehydrogenase
MDILLFLLSCILAAVAVSLMAVPPSKSWAYLLLVVGMMTLALGFIGFASLEQRNGNLLIQSFSLRTLRGRTTLASLVSGLALGSWAGGVLALIYRRVGSGTGLLGGLSFLLFLFPLTLMALKSRLSKFLPDPTATAASGFIQQEVAKPWKLSKLVEIPLIPTAITFDESMGLLVCGYSGGYYQSASVARVNLESKGVTPSVSQIARDLTRPHGIAFADGKIYVSRSGQYSKAVHGKLDYAMTGAVTRLEDLNGDGIYEYHHDVISDLPGARAPDALHQNNAVAFDDQGNLYVAVGTPTDHAPQIGPYDGRVLQLKPDSTTPEVFCEGFRNPYGMAFVPGLGMICTDNDSSLDSGGDKVYLLKEGQTYPHPLGLAQGVEVEGLTPPLLTISSAQGIAYMPKGANTPIDGCLVVASYGDEAINVIRLPDVGSGGTPQVEFLARIPTPVAVACSSDGRVFACSYEDRSVYQLVLE